MKIKRRQTEHPFSDFWVYRIWHNKEGRWQANLINKHDTKVRTTLSWARYSMSVKMGRLLDTRTEHVDHIDNDRTNDSIVNLQILTPEQNKAKYDALYESRNPRFVKIGCFNCGKVFDYIARNFKFHKSRGRERFHCSRECSYETLRKPEDKVSEPSKITKH